MHQKKTTVIDIQIFSPTVDLSSQTLGPDTNSVHTLAPVSMHHIQQDYNYLQHFNNLTSKPQDSFVLLKV